MKIEDENVMVTGAAGFIGSNLVGKLLKSNNKVIGYDNFDDFYVGKERNIEEYLKNPKFNLVRSDILNFKELDNSMKNVKIVFHLAAQAGVRFSNENPWKTNKTNVEGTLNVLLSAVKNNVEKVIFASSSSVYGMDPELPCSENQMTSPTSVYGASKLAGEDYCLTFFRSYNLPTVILRYHTVYGPRQRPDMGIYIFTKAIFDEKSPIVFGDGEQTRDFTYVSDVVEGTLLAAEKKEADGQVFNIGSSSPVSINRVIALIGEISGKKNISPIYEDEKRGDVRDTYANIQKSMDVLGYKPKTNIKNGLKKFVRWFKSHK